MSIITIHSQNLLDISTQESGSIEAVFDHALLNDLSITDQLEVGSSLEAAQSEHANSDITAYYKQRIIKPATGAVVTERISEGAGIGSMEIEGITNVFKVG
ncbi:hypothetical protein [Pseudotenacibaculum haliotis]|uniref:Uncharacterized protein n=1 Tax=Pseudotenacibaculum haliotis TaxID=1862138 RepID=A0ABW5LMU6_9FLAO